VSLFSRRTLVPFDQQQSNSAWQPTWVSASF